MNQIAGMSRYMQTGCPTGFVILGLLKAAPETLALAERHVVDVHQCACSAITGMELLGFPGLQPAEEKLIQERLRHLAYLPLIAEIEVLR